VPPTDQKEVTALVQCRINNDGTITNIVLKKSCGDSSLDALATEALERARRFPPFPDDFTKSYVDVEISFFYMQ